MAKSRSLSNSPALSPFVDGHQDLPSDGHEVAAMAITEGDRIRWSSRREICSLPNICGKWPSMTSR
jgi:hypothetical protein